MPVAGIAIEATYALIPRMAIGTRKTIIACIIILTPIISIRRVIKKVYFQFIITNFALFFIDSKTLDPSMII